MIKKVEWNNLPAIEMEAGGYRALIVPSVGSNLVRLVNTTLGIDILRTPKSDEMEIFTTRPQIFGMPILFPPNRIEDGTYTFKGRKYDFPINLPAQNNHLHGILKTEPFTVTRCEQGDGWASVETCFFSNCFNSDIFEYFPHNFECRLLFVLSDSGMNQTVTFKNLDAAGEMPFAVGYHTAVNVPFLEGTAREDYRLQASVGKHWILSNRNLPTGEIVALDEQESKMRTEGMDPFYRPLDDSFTAEPIVVDGKPYHGAIITETKSGRKVFYEVDDKMKHWVFWNNGAGVPWFCPEPQTWAINAPNLKLSDEITGLTSIEAGKSWSSTTLMYAK